MLPNGVLHGARRTFDSSGPSARAAPFWTELRRLHGTARASGLAYFRRPVQLDARARHALESLEPSVAAAGTAHRCRMACATQPDTWHAPCNVRIAAVGLMLRRVRSLPTFVGKGRHTTAERQTQTPLWAVLQWRQANRPTAGCNSVCVMEFCWMCSDCSAARAQRSKLVPDSQPVGYSLGYLNTCALTRPEAQPTHSAAAPTAVFDRVVRASALCRLRHGDYQAAGRPRRLGPGTPSAPKCMGRALVHIRGGTAVRTRSTAGRGSDARQRTPFASAAFARPTGRRALDIPSAWRCSGHAALFAFCGAPARRTAGPLRQSIGSILAPLLPGLRVRLPLSAAQAGT